MQIAEVKSNEDIINEHTYALQTEINLSDNYKKINRNTLSRLLRFHKNNKSFTKMKTEDILSYLNSLSVVLFDADSKISYDEYLPDAKRMIESFIVDEIGPIIEEDVEDAQQEAADE